jgi:transaldolase
MTAGGGRLGRLAGQGVAIWVDGLGRERVLDGGLASLARRRSVTGALLGPAALYAGLRTGAYEEQISLLAKHAPADGGAAEAALTLLAADARPACEALLPAFESGRGRDGLVAVAPDLGAEPTAAGIRVLVHRLVENVDRPNLLVTLPATQPALAAATAVLAEGVGVVVGPVTNAADLATVTEAYFAGLELALENGAQGTPVASFLAYALSQTDTEVDKRLWAVGTDRSASFRGRAAVAAARVSYAVYEELYAGARWKSIEKAVAGAQPQRLLWCSTRARDPYYSETLYVDSLVAPGVVNAMTEQTMGIVAESAEITADTLHGRFHEDAEETLAGIAAVGVDVEAVARTAGAAAAAREQNVWHTIHEMLAARITATGVLQ